MDEDDLLEMPPEQPPTLDDFREQIDLQIQYKESVEDIRDFTTFAWLKVDARPFKSALINCILKWKYMFTQYLHDQVVHDLGELNEFITQTNDALGVEIRDGDYQALIHRMSILSDIRERQEIKQARRADDRDLGDDYDEGEGDARDEPQVIVTQDVDEDGNVTERRRTEDATDRMFRETHEKIATLKEYSLEMEAETVELLNTLPQEWTNLKRTMYTVNEKLAPLRQSETDKIKARRDVFVGEVEQVPPLDGP